ncbi:response regulator [Pyxidicoccus parkwayensis]|uniref:histidine kinase n=1 Tax=Pyxidicoccus parkwayensis TaxID=2813578 RepID=A0ABX7NYF5_9BACT|nr:ATP-binding protein [Pyxidicoccus parkwaysis]QSQ22426.1 response regulator [Pyxidicoccus parkwaysis]
MNDPMGHAGQGVLTAQALPGAMEGLAGGLRELLYGAWFMPHGHCYLWRPDLVALHVLSDVLTGAAYLFISVSLYRLVRRLRLPFGGMILSFGVFIGACGLTHLMEVWNVWNSAYWLAGGVKGVTAVASVATGVYLLPFRRKVAKGVESARLSEERRAKLETSSRELEALYARLKESEAQRTGFFANVSHELRTPLALIIGPVDRLLERGVLSLEDQRDLEVVRRNARVLMRHVNALLDVAKLDAGKLQASYAETDLARLVRLCAENFEGLVAERRLRFELVLPGMLPAQVDPEQLQRVVLNLLSNAVKFTPAGGILRVALSAEAGWGRLVVEDSGPGVAPELREVIFERFRQGECGDSTTREFGGTGLGLAIARDFVTLHGGRIHVEERPGGGACFVVDLPLLAPSDAKLRSMPEPESLLSQVRAELDVLRTRAEEPVVVPTTEDPYRPSVLVVEDTREMRRFVAETLEQDFRVATASDGEDGLRLAESLRPDVIVSDLMMPRMGGDQLVREVRAREGLESTPILMLTARADDAMRVDLLRSGAQDYLVKPFLAEELLARVSNLAVMKRTREVLQGALTARTSDVEFLARELGLRKRQLEAALETTSTAREAAERASESRSTLLRLVSHELRTPLSVLQLTQHAFLKEVGPLGVKASEMFERMTRSTVRLRDMTEMVLQYNQLEQGRLVVRREPVDLVELAEEVLGEVRGEADRKGLKLALARPAGKALAQTDPRMAQLVLLNLVMNAVKYTHEGGIHVAVEVVADARRMRVRDSGPGIPLDAQARVFEPFQQLETLEHKSKPGVGLGLTLVRELVSVLGGKVSLKSEPGTGSEFTVELPS